MQIASVASGQTTLINKEIETSVQKLLFRLSLASNLPITTPAEIKAALTAIIGTAQISVLFDEVLTPLNKASLLTIAEACTNNEGTIHLSSTGTVLTCEFTIELSNSGAVRASDNRKVTVDISGKVSSSTMDVYALDHPADAVNLLITEAKFINANTEKDFNVDDADVITLPIENLVDIKINYNNGRLVTFSKDELKSQMKDSQDMIISTPAGVVTGYLNQACINVEMATRVTVKLDTSTSFYITKTKSI